MKTFLFIILAAMLLSACTFGGGFGVGNGGGGVTVGTGMRF
ncbi:hypothetical protein RYD26_05730 [Pasteurellaceae bacterium LIM206]|nr:hypothetical protein [Pasteurellaceae bacterium LIM206]